MSYAGAVELMRSTAEVNRVIEIGDGSDLADIEKKLAGEDWEQTKPLVYRKLGLEPSPNWPTVNASMTIQYSWPLVNYILHLLQTRSIILRLIRVY